MAVANTLVPYNKMSHCYTHPSLGRQNHIEERLATIIVYWLSHTHLDHSTYLREVVVTIPCQALPAAQVSPPIFGLLVGGHSRGLQLPALFDVIVEFHDYKSFGFVVVLGSLGNIPNRVEVQPTVRRVFYLSDGHEALGPTRTLGDNAVGRLNRSRAPSQS